MHVDDFINMPNGDKEYDYARFVLHLARLPAIAKTCFEPWTKQFKLFCTFEGKRYRVTGASRLGDVWLAGDYERTIGYDKRVEIEKCSAWSDKP